MTQNEEEEVGRYITNHTLKVIADKYLAGKQLDRFLKNITLEINRFDEKLKRLLTKQEIQILNEAIQTKTLELSQGQYNDNELTLLKSYFINWQAAEGIQNDQ